MQGLAMTVYEGNNLNIKVEGLSEPIVIQFEKVGGRERPHAKVRCIAPRVVKFDRGQKPPLTM